MRRAVAEVPVPRRDVAGGLVSELDGQRRLARGRRGGEAGHWGRGRRRSYGNRRALAAAAAAAGDGQGDGEIAGAIVRVGGVLRRAMSRAVTEIPVPNRDGAGGSVGELDRQWDLAGSRISGEVGGRAGLVVIGNGDGGTMGRAGGITGAAGKGDDDCFRPFDGGVVNGSDSEIGRASCRERV